MTIENVGPKFDLNAYLKARDITKKVVKEIALQVNAGIEEKVLESMLLSELKHHGVDKYWHPTKIRFGTNTTKSFRDPSEAVTLENNDLFFIDIGPVLFEHEADYGETFLLGENSEYSRLKDATYEIFSLAEIKWRDEKLSGEALYRFAEAEALRRGYELNTKMYGHRLGDFPHALYYKGNLGTLDFSPAEKLWVLEIHILDKKLNRGAFYEDILT